MSQVEEAHPPTFDNKETSSSIGFDWSLMPCTIFLKLFTGIRLNWTGKESTFLTVLFAVYSLFLLLSNLLITTIYTVYFSKFSSGVPLPDNYSIFEEIKNFNMTHIIGMNPALFIESLNKLFYIFWYPPLLLFVPTMGT